MYELKRKTWFKTIAFLMIHLFVLSQSAVALNADDKYQKQKRLKNKNMSESTEINLEQESPVTTGYSGLAAQGYSKAKNTEQTVDLGNVVDNLSDCDLSTKSMILKASGANESEAATALMGKGDTAKDVAGALVEVGYDEQKVQAFLENIIKTEQQDAQNNQPATASENIEIATTTESSPDIVVDTAETTQTAAAEQTDITNETQQSISVSSQTTQAEVTYASLADQGLTDTQIVSQLKAEGASATDILKSATALDRDMVSVAGAMQEAGFSNVDIATAYIAKASDWAVDATVNVVNCAVQSLAEVLTGVSDIGSAVTDLAYEVIVSDIMQSGEVNIQDGQIMSSMNAIKEVASEHGVELQGTNATVADLENMQGSAIVHLDDNHWAVVTDISGDTVTLMDNGTEVTMSKSELQSRWDGNVLSQENTGATQLTANQMLHLVGAADPGDGPEGCGNGCGGPSGGGDSGGSGEGGGDGPGPASGPEGLGNWILPIKTDSFIQLKIVQNQQVNYNQ